MDPFDVIADERRALADLLDGLSAEQLATPSLCAGWSVRDVGAHLLIGPTATLRELGLALIRARGRFDAAGDLLVRGRASLSGTEIAALLREHAASRFTPPTFDWHAPLADLRLHGLDMAVPLGVELGRPAAPWCDVLDFLVSRKARTGFVRGGLPALRLEADDVDWSHAAAPDAPLVQGSAAALAATLAGRPALADRLTGPGAAALVAWCRSAT